MVATASGFGLYVRWDLLREAGEKPYRADRFDYDFSNIYRSNQGPARGPVKDKLPSMT